MARASAAIGRNTTYLRQYLRRGMPRALSYQDTVTLARLLECDPAELQHESRPLHASSARPKRHRRPPLSLVTIPEIPFSRQTDPDTILEPSDPRGTMWRIPEQFFLYESHANLSGVRILYVEDDAMAPELQAGHRVIFDTSRPWLSLGEQYVLWDGNAVVIKRVGWGDRTEPLTYCLFSSGRFHPPYTCPRSKIRFFGNALWTVRR